MVAHHGAYFFKLCTVSLSHGFYLRPLMLSPGCECGGEEGIKERAQDGNERVHPSIFF
jgi:hypothetical protein